MPSPDYWAGLVDGEGCIFIQKWIRSPRNIEYRIRVSVTMTHEPIVRLFSAHFGGTFQVVKRNKDNPKHSDAYLCIVTGGKAVSLIQALLPYLIVKQEEARLAIKLYEARMRHSRRSSRLSQDEYEAWIAEQDYYCCAIKALKGRNRRGFFVNLGEFGGHPMPGSEMSAEGQYRAKQLQDVAGVCNEQVPRPKGKICSGLHGNMQSEAEMTSPHKLSLVQ